MNRREFLKNTLVSAAALGMAANLDWRLASAFAAELMAESDRTIINTMLLGGADLRYLFVPDPTTAYATKFWEARQNLYRNNAANRAKYTIYEDVWADLYLPTETDGISFGIHKNAAWLKDQFDAGKVAIIANVLGSDNRRHDHSQLIIDAGDPQTGEHDLDRDGWGGRLAYAIGDANVVAVTRDISLFCKGVDVQNRNAKVVHAKDTRAFALSSGNASPASDKSKLARALKNYYAQKRLEVLHKPANWPYHKFFQHEYALRTFGDAFNDILDQQAPEQPIQLQALYKSQYGAPLNSQNFGQQCAGIYDIFVAADLFKPRVISSNYSGWDTHNSQKDRFESNIEDIFGSGKGVATLAQECAPLGVSDKLVYVFTTDFGRQLRANGDFGTDHGSGNYVILYGENVGGGVYGAMFPQSEIEENNGQTPYDKRGSDIEGLTGFTRILSQLCDWVAPGSGAQVFPDAATSALENGVDLSRLI